MSDDRERLKRMELLFSSTRDMMAHLGTTELEDQLQRIAEAARTVLNAEACGIFLVKEKDHEPGKELSLEASAGHRPDGFRRGMRLPIISRPGCGLTSHIAHEAKLFSESGPKLINHFAVREKRNLLEGHHTKGPCYSLLAFPLMRRSGEEEELVGLLRVDNKQDDDREVYTDRGFDEMDKWIIRLFADMAVVAIENAELMHYRRSLISSCPSGIIAVNSHGDVTEYNSRAAEILGRSREQVLGKPVDDLYFDPEEPKRIGRLLHQTEGPLTKHETFVKGPSGEAIPILHSATWLISGGRKVGSVGYFEDDRRRRSLVRREKLLKAIELMANASDLDEGLQQFTDALVREVGRSYAAVLLDDDSERPLALRASSRGDAPQWRASAIPRITAAERLETTGLWPERDPELLTWSDDQQRPRLQRISRLLGFERHVPSLLVVPLTIGASVIGQLVIGERQREKQEAFSEDETEILTSVATQVSVVVDRLRLLDQTKFREKRLSDLARVAAELRAQAETSALLQQTASLAVELVEYESGGVFLRYLSSSRLELKTVHGLPGGLVGIEAEQMELIARAAETGQTQKATSFSLRGATESVDLREVFAVPLRGSAGEVEGVLFVANKQRRDGLDRIDQDVLERFASMAATALQTSRLLGDEHRIAGRLEVLHRIGDYILQSSNEDWSLHAFLTGVTAGYGLRFNRAFLLLKDDLGKYLVGKRGIGELENAIATAAWQGDADDHLDDFGRYLQRLESGQITMSTVDTMIKGLHLELGRDDAFSKAVASGTVQVVETHNILQIPEVFRNTFRVTSTVVVAPLKTKNGVLGVLVVDNKFTQALLEQTLLEALIAFASTAAIAIENRNLLQETLTGEATLLSFYAMSSQLATVGDPEKILRTIVEQTSKVAGAYGVSLLLYDEQSGNFRNPMPLGADREVHRHEIVRRDSLTMDVMQTGKVLRIPDVANATSVNPLMIQRGIKAALCLPLSLPNRRLGVMWIHYDRPRQFPDSMVAALQLFVNQAGIAYEQARHIEGLEKVREAAETLTAIETVDGVVEQIVESARRAFEAQSAILWLYDRNNCLPERSVMRGLSEAMWERLRKEPTVTATLDAAIDKASIIVADMNKETQYRRVLQPPTLELLSSIPASGFLAVALSVGDEHLGVLWTLHTQPLIFSEERLLIAEQFADHAAWSLKKARLLQRVTRAKAAAAVVSKLATDMPKRTESLQMIAEQAMQAIGCDAVVLFENDEVGGIVHPAAAAGVLDPDGLRDPSEKKDYGLVESILARPAPRLVRRVLDEDDFKEKRFVEAEGIRSCAAVPLRAHDRAVGAMFVNYRVEHSFTSEETDDMQLFANQAAAAIYSAQLIDSLNKKIKELRAAQDLAKARTDLAWTGLLTIDWSHDLGRHVSTITESIGALRREIEALDRNDLAAKLDAIGDAIKSVVHPPRLQYDAPEEHVFDVAKDLLEPFRDHLRECVLPDAAGVELDEDFNEARDARVKASSRWLRSVLDHLVRNALASFQPAAPEKRIALAAERCGPRLQIRVTDNGPGIPAEIRAQIFKGPIRKTPASPGLGIGLLIAQTIAQISGGDLELSSPEEPRTTVTLSLPLVEDERSH